MSGSGLTGGIVRTIELMRKLNNFSFLLFPLERELLESCRFLFGIDWGPTAVGRGRRRHGGHPTRFSPAALGELGFCPALFGGHGDQLQKPPRS